ncbi:MAG: rod shape-determining protein RodA [Rickettsiaceae bacterium]|jgi:rod shape determining protein RodA|nr:rod shape-determining protein RodA [Rickettsiaceae bacterium]
MLSYFNNRSIAEKFFALNWRLVFLIIILANIGFAMLYSAAGGNLYPWLFKQMIFFFIFFPVMLAIAVIDVKFWLRTSYLYYAIALVLIIAVDIMGHHAMGATRWFAVGGFTLQPSEIMKVCLVFALAKYFYNINVDEIEKTKYAIAPALMIAIPTFFIFDQPDLGTATIVLLVGVSILFLAGVKMQNFIFVGVAGLVTIPFLWIFVLYDYQKQRVLNFINPDNDPLGSGYNIIQSKIAIGSGGFFGKGYLNGTQGQLEFLPEKQTDFIFTMLSEELGFIGSITTIFIYALIIYMGTRIAFKAKHQFGRLLALGITNILFIHVFVNMGMTMGLLPVVGAPLPLISYGGTITASMLIGFGLLLNVDVHSELEDIRER